MGEWMLDSGWLVYYLTHSISHQWILFTFLTRDVYRWDRGSAISAHIFQLWEQLLKIQENLLVHFSKVKTENGESYMQLIQLTNGMWSHKNSVNKLLKSSKFGWFFPSAQIIQIWMIWVNYWNHPNLDDLLKLLKPSKFGWFLRFLKIIQIWMISPIS